LLKAYMLTSPKIFLSYGFKYQIIIQAYSVYMFF